jgi:hypothetical protein
MKTLKALLSQRKEIQLAPAALTDKDIFYIFRRVVKEEFGALGVAKFQADYFKNKTIFVKSESSAWAAELFSNRSRIVRKMNEELGARAIREIKLK